MNKKANALYFLTASISIIMAAAAGAGVFESLNKELTGLVKKAEPYLVTIEAGSQDIGKVLVGSGILMSSEGHILTVASVVDELSEIRVVFQNGDSYGAELVGSDHYSGLALLKIEPVKRQLPKLGDPNKLEEGSWVIAIGNSFDMPSAVNLGVFSGLTDFGLLQLSMQSGPGGAGGAIFNTAGELVGILVAQPTETFSLLLPPEDQVRWRVKSRGAERDYRRYGLDLPSTGTSLAVPADKIAKLVAQLKDRGEVKRGYLGIRQARLTQREKKQRNVEGGVVVKDVVKDSPGEKGGLKADDILVKYNGISIKGPGHLLGLVRSSMPGDKARIEVLRDSATVEADVILGEASSDDFFGAGDFGNDWLALDVDRLTGKTLGLQDQLKSYSFDLSGQQGIKRPYHEADLKELDHKLDKLQHRLDELSSKIADLYLKLENK